MSQHDFNLENQVGAAFRSDLNAALSAFATKSSGLTAPTNPYPFMWWQDTTTGLLKIRNAANDAWIIMGAWADPSNMSFYTANVLRMLINSAGNVGIGTTSPTTALDVVGRINASSILTVGGMNVLGSLGKPAEGRLTIRGGYPAPDITGGTEDGYSTTGNTVYYSPYLGNRVSLWWPNSPSGWYTYDFDQISVTLPSTANKNYDILISADAAPWNNPNINLNYAAWSTDTGRNNAITRQDGIYVTDSDKTKRYLGTVRTNGSGVIADTPTQRFVWNMYNRITRNARVKESAASWSYTTAAWRYANGNSANKIEWVCGFAEDAIDAYAYGRAAAASQLTVGVGLGLDGITPNAGSQFLAPSTGQNAGTASWQGYSGVQGYHYLSWLEYGQGSTAATFYGASSSWPTGMNAILRC